MVLLPSSTKFTDFIRNPTFLHQDQAIEIHWIWDTQWIPWNLTHSDWKNQRHNDPGPGVVTTPGSTHVAKLETPASWASGSPSPGTQGGSRGRSKSRRSWGSNCMGLYTPNGYFSGENDDPINLEVIYNWWDLIGLRDWFKSFRQTNVGKSLIFSIEIIRYDDLMFIGTREIFQGCSNLWIG